MAIKRGGEREEGLYIKKGRIFTYYLGTRSVSIGCVYRAAFVRASRLRSAGGLSSFPVKIHVASVGKLSSTTSLCGRMRDGMMPAGLHLLVLMRLSAGGLLCCCRHRHLRCVGDEGGGGGGDLDG